MSLLPGSWSPEYELILCFVHGFQGSSKTFKNLPKDLGLKSLFFEFLSTGQNQPEQLSNYLAENAPAVPIGGGVPSKVILIAHSMGGIVSMDCIKLGRNSNIIGLVAFDSPFFSVDLIGTHSKFTKPIQKAAAATTGWGLLGAALATGALALAASNMTADQKSEVANRLFSTSEFLDPLWQVHGMQTRFEILKQYPPPIYFAGVYLELLTTKERFCTLPPEDLQKYFTPLICDGEHTVDVHMHMFDNGKPWYNDLLTIARTKINECVYKRNQL